MKKKISGSLVLVVALWFAPLAAALAQQVEGLSPTEKKQGPKQQLKKQKQKQKQKEQGNQQAEKQQSTLEERLEALNLPINQAAGQVSSDKLYAVQNRYAPLSKRHEFSFNWAKNLNVDGFLTSNQVGGSYRYHISDKWTVGFSGIKVFNELSSSGERLLRVDGILPEKDFLKLQAEANVEYNLFYGKFRLSIDQVFYFDQYVTMGLGIAQLSSGTVPTGSIETGLAFWLGKSGSLRAGLRNEFYQETTIREGKKFSYNLVAQFSIGYLLGGSSK